MTQLHKTYLVGGAVRDMLMGREPKDYDYVVVGATPEYMVANGFVQVGADFPVFLNQRGEEFALARTERKTGDGYLGFAVETDGVTLEDDLARRDLTINAMAMINDEVVDPFGGQADLVNKVLRHVSPSFAEDPLRVVRLARFRARFTDFKIAEETRDLSIDIVRRGDLNHLPAERFWAELHKVFTEDSPSRFFYFLYAVEADQHVTFFNGLYGAIDSNVFNMAAAVREHAPEDDRVMIHTALVARDGPILKTADTRTQVLHANIQQLRQLSQSCITADGVFAVLKSAKTWSDGSGLMDLHDAMVVASAGGERFVMKPTDLLAAAFATKRVTAANYMPQFEGRALGQAIEKGRKEAIMELFNLRDGDIAVADEV